MQLTITEEINKTNSAPETNDEDEENIKKTLDYFLSNIFRHGDDVRVWDKDGCPDMWSSDTDWLIENFNKEINKNY